MDMANYRKPSIHRNIAKKVDTKEKQLNENVVFIYTYRPDDLAWRQIVFLPFNFYWRIFIATVGIISCNITLFEEVFLMGHYKNMAFQNLMTSFTIFYAIDVGLSLLHRTWESVQKSMPYQPKSTFVLCLDAFSLIPLQGFADESLLTEDGTINWINLLTLNVCLRVYRVYVELFLLQKRMDLNPIIVCFIQHNAIMLCLASFFCCLWYALGYIHKNAPKSWLSDFMENHSLDMTNPGLAYALSFMQVFVLLNRTVVMNINPISYLEKWLFSAMLYLGYLFRSTYMMSTMISSIIKSQQHKYIIKDHIAINKKCTIKKYHKAIEEYYIIYWNNWFGLQKRPDLDMYPLCLQKDVLTDMYWEAMQHSHLLRYFTINVKRELGLAMKSKYMQPGDHIFRKGHLRSSFFYIASGVVQVMSHYDGVSPIITLSAGSCLGSLSLALPTPCPTDVICATECEVRFLTCRAYFTALANHKDASKISLETSTNHIAHVKLMYTLSKTTNVENPVMKLYGVSQDNKLKWVKQRFLTESELNEINVTSSYINNLEKTILPLSKGHTSKYLDQLVLSSELKWNTDKCCYKTAFPYVLEPKCHFIKAWHLFVVILITIDSIIVPYWLAYMGYSSDIILMWDQIICIAYLTDIYLQVITAVRSVDSTITDSCALLRHHFKKVGFVIDIFGSIPIRQLSKMFLPSAIKTNYLGLHRLCKLIRVYTLFKYHYGLITSKVIISHVMKTVYLFAMVTHISACFAFILACELPEGQLTCVKDSWFDRYTRFPDRNMDNVLVYLVSSWTFVGELLEICGLDVNLTTIFSNAIFSTIVVFLARNIMTFTISELMALWIMRRQRELVCNELVVSLKSVLQQKHLHQGLTNMIVRYIYLQWQANFAIDQPLDLGPSFDILCPVALENRERDLKDTLKSVHFFNSLDDEMFNRISSYFERYIVPKRYIFCRSGERPSSFNIILRGTCCATSMLKEDLLENSTGKMVGKGSHFSLLEILQDVSSFQTVVSVTITEVAAIDAEQLKACLFADKVLVYQIKSATIGFPADILTGYDVVISKLRYMKAQPKVPEFVPAIRTKSKQPPIRFDQLKSNWQKFKYVFNLFWSPPYMINPRGNYIHVWELLKLLQAIATVLYVPAMLLFMCDEHNLRFGVPLLLDAFSFIDIIVRLHIGVHDEIGVLRHTRWYYLTHAFTVDLISTIPTYLLLSDRDVRVNFGVSLFTKVLQLYRISGYIFVLKFKIDVTDFKLITINFCLHFVLVIYLMACCLFCYSCEVECNKGQHSVVCSKDTWVNTNELYKDINNPLSLFLSSTYISLALMTGSDTGPFSTKTLRETKCLLISTVVACLAICYYLPKASAQLVDINSSFTKYRETIKQFMFFIKLEGGDKDIASKITAYFAYSYMRLKGLNMQKVLRSAHPSLVSDLSFAMYYKATKCLHMFVGDSRSLMMILTREVQELHMLKGTTVIDINQVNDNIYFVCKGIISVVNNDNETIRLLQAGSMFGSFRRVGKTRHKFKYVSLINVCLLEISTSKFLRIFTMCDKYESAVFSKLTEDREYISVTKRTLDSELYIELPTTSKPRGLLSKDMVIYQLAMFILSMVVPYLTIFPLLLSIVLYTEYETFYVTLIYIFDLIMCLRVIIGLNTTYADEQTGVFTSSKRQIRLAYLSKPTKFALDILSLFPFEIIWYTISRKWVNSLRINRMLRILMIMLHAYEHRQIAFVRLWMRWFSFICHVTLTPYILVIVWLYFTCSEVCKDTPNTTFTDRVEFIMHSVNEVVIMITFSSSNTFKLPSTDVNCTILILMVAISYILNPFLIADFIHKLEMASYRTKMYEYKLYCVKLYMQLRDLSNSLLNQLWDYSLLLWSTNRGEYLPEFLISAPISLKCQLMYDLYGGHIYNNILFEECHSSFIYQLIGRLKRTVYFPGDVIVRKFDVDGRMYFINSGEVEAVEYDELNKEMVQNVFITGQCFGLVQGLEERMAHTFTYKARSTVELLHLERSEYEDLMEAFPEEKAKIFNRAERISLMEQ